MRHSDVALRNEINLISETYSHHESLQMVTYLDQHLYQIQEMMKFVEEKSPMYINAILTTKFHDQSGHD